MLLGGAITAGVWAQTPTPQPPALKDAYKDAFLVGAAINQAQIYEQDARGVNIVRQQFDSITPENILKWRVVHPKPDVYDFAAADKYVEFGEKNHMFLIGHTLVWHNQTPKWVFEDEKGNPLTRKALLKRMHDHIKTVVGRYKGRIKGWDVVNEALDEDGTMRQSPWMKIIGDDYIEKAFQYAHKADPKAELYYNDYSLENEPKRKGAIALIRKLKSEGIPVKAIGLQGHDTLDWPSLEQQDATIAAFEQLGVKINITELDITVLPSALRQQTAEVTATAESKPDLNPYVDGLPDTVQQALSKRYADLFTVFLKHRNAVERVTFWGVTDGDSWRNHWPARGRTDYPLLFDRNGAPKPAFEAVIHAARAETAKN
jgi:endo-1,4-beta-xylanase